MKIDLVHLTKRFFYALDFRPLHQKQIVTAKSVLSEPEFALWSSMRLGDKRHSLKVLARFSALLPQASVAERRAVLLHDVGKLQSDLGILMRVVATIIGPRNARLAAYHDHERIGATMLKKIGSEEQTYRLVGADFSADSDPTSSMANTLAALRRADKI